MERILEFHYPLYATFCITSKCNAKCKHCSSASDNNITNDLSTDEIIRILHELSECGVMQIGISGGEPLLHPNFDVIVRTAVDLGFIVGVGTNGIAVNRDVVKSVKELGIHHIQVSLDGSNCETHDSFRGIKGIFNRAMNAIAIMVGEGVKVNVCMTPTKYNYLELEELIDICAGMGVNSFNLSQFVPTGRGLKEMDLLPLQWKEILELWYKKKNQYEHIMKFTSHESQLILIDSSLDDAGSFIGCQAGRGVCCIKPDGTLTPCVMLDVSAGNLKKDSFKEIWHKSEVIKSLRDRSTYGEPCRSCVHVRKCGGCRGVAYGINGDYLSYDPRCWLNMKN